MIKIKMRGVNLKTDKVSIARKVLEMLEEKIPSGAAYTTNSTIDLRGVLVDKPDPLDYQITTTTDLENYMNNDLQGDLEANRELEDASIENDFTEMYLPTIKTRPVAQRRRKRKHQGTWSDEDNDLIYSLMEIKTPTREIRNNRVLLMGHTKGAISTRVHAIIRKDKRALSSEMFARISDLDVTFYNHKA